MDPPMQFRQSLDLNEEGEGQGRVSVRTFVFELRSRGPKAQKKVDGFIDDAFEFYKMKKGEEIDKSRYLYQPVLSSGSKKDDGSDDDGDKVGVVVCDVSKNLRLEKLLDVFCRSQNHENLPTLSHTGGVGLFFAPERQGNTSATYWQITRALTLSSFPKSVSY